MVPNRRRIQFGRRSKCLLRPPHLSACMNTSSRSDQLTQETKKRIHPATRRGAARRQFALDSDLLVRGKRPIWAQPQKHPLLTSEWPTIHPVIINLSLGVRLTSIQIHAPTAKALASNRARRKCYASRRRSRCEQFVAGQRRSATSARTESSAREDACQRHLLHRRPSNARTFARTIPPNPRPRAGRRDHCGGSRRHHAKGRRPCGYRLDSIHLRPLRMVPAWPQDVLSLSEGYWH